MSHLHDTQTFFSGKPTISVSGDGYRMESMLWKLVLLAAVAYLVWSDRPLVVFSDATGLGIESSTVPQSHAIARWFGLGKEEKTAKLVKAQVAIDPGEMNNATFAMDPGFAKRNRVAQQDATARLDKCREYVERFAPVAMAEMRKFGIPASITLAQALLESNAGESKLVQAANNHFGIKCTAKHCKKGHCINYADDSHKDFFVKYANAWGSFRAHSQNLHDKKRYAFLFELAPTDYRGWARGLVEAGYATDKKYAIKLVALIERLELNRFDQLP